MRTLKRASRCLRFSSYEPNSVSIPSSGTVMRFIGSILGLQMELAQLFRIHGGRRARHEIDGVRRLRKRDDLADRGLARENGHYAIEPERDAAVRRRSVLEGLHKKTKAQLRLLLRNTQAP